MCSALVFSMAKASTTALDSLASYLPTVLSLSVARIQPGFSSELVTTTPQVSSNSCQVAVESATRSSYSLGPERACCTISTKTIRASAGLLTSRRNAIRAPRMPSWVFKRA